MNTESSLPPPVPPTPAAYPPPPPKKKRRWFLWTVLIFSLLINFGTCTSRMSKMAGVGSEQYPAVTETLVWGDLLAETKVAVVRLEGVILREGSSSLFGEVIDPVTKILNEIRAATVDPEVRGILLEVNSPGGGVTASDEIYQALMDFKASDRNRKIVVHVRDMAASGGYYVALAGDVLVAQPTSVVGSIGVIISAVNMHQLGEKIGIEDVSLTSSSNKALLNALEPVDPEHKQILQTVVDQMYARFRGLVIENRPFDEGFADENQLLDGRIFSQTDALNYGLVDESGYIDHSRKRMTELLGRDNVAFYSFEYSGSGWSSLFAVESPEILAPLTREATFQYLWKP